MDLTPENKDHIDSLNYEQMLYHLRFAPFGDPWFKGETRAYWMDRMNLLRKQCDPVAISKRVG